MVRYGNVFEQKYERDPLVMKVAFEDLDPADPAERRALADSVVRAFSKCFSRGIVFLSDDCFMFEFWRDGGHLHQVVDAVDEILVEHNAQGVKR